MAGTDKIEKVVSFKNTDELKSIKDTTWENAAHTRCHKCQHCLQERKKNLLKDVSKIYDTEVLYVRNGFRADKDRC